MSNVNINTCSRYEQDVPVWTKTHQRQEVTKLTTPKSTNSEWLPILGAHSVLKEEFQSLRSFRYHMGQRAINGLKERDAVREGPFGLLIHADRVRAWLIAEPLEAA